MENIILKIKEVWNNLKNMFKQIWRNIKLLLLKIYSHNDKFRNLFSLYNRTKKKRVRKKYYNKMIRFIINHPIRG